MGGQPVQHGLRGTGCGFVQDTQLQAEPVRQVNGAGRNIPPPSAFAPAHTMKPAPWIFLPLALLAGCRVQTVPPTAAVAQAAPAAAPTPVEQPVPESCAMLTPEQYRVLREGGTERPFTSELLHNKAKGTYVCAGCGLELFSSETKYDSGSGWPSFYAPIAKGNVLTKLDESHGM